MRISSRFALASCLLASSVSACRSAPSDKAAAMHADVPFSVRIPQSIDEVLGYADETQFAIALSNFLTAREDAVGYAALNPAERVIFSLNGLETEVNNGGFGHYFLNSTGDHANDAPAALRALGAPKVASLVERALAVFPAHGPSPDQTARAAQVAALSNEARHQLDLLDAVFYQYPEPLDQLARAFVTVHRKEFLAPPNAGGSLIPAE